MRGEFAGVKGEIFRELYEPLLVLISDADLETDDLGLELLQEAIQAPERPEIPAYSAYNEDGEIFRLGDIEARTSYETQLENYQQRVEAYNDASVDRELAWAFIRDFFEDDATTERHLISAIEEAFEPIDELGGDALSNEYFQLVERFIEKFSLRYDIRRPSYARTLSLHPTLPGLFSRLLKELKESTSQDPALAELMGNFEETIIDLRGDNSSRRIKQCIAAQFNLFEAMLSLHPDVVAHNDGVAVHNATASNRQQRNPANSFGSMCDKAQVWPHTEVLKSAKSLYKFASDYPGIRHGGTPANQKREIDMRDMISMAIILAGFSPYINADLNAELIYSD